jgi:hypothetical protein
MQNQINLTPITQFIQSVRSAELTGSKQVSMDIAKARLLALALSEMQDKLLRDYETLLNDLKRSVDSEVVTVQLDGGGFDNK